MAKNNLIIPQVKRTHEDLERLKALPLPQKIALFKRRFAQFYTYFNGQVYGAFSGGKDSTMMMHLIWEDYPDVPAVFSNTGLEYPEIVSFVKEVAKKHPVEIIRPKLSFKQVIDKYGWAVVSKEQSQFIQEYRTTKSEKLKNTRINGNKAGRGKIAKKHLYLLDAPFDISHKCCEALKKGPFKHYEKETGRKAVVGTMTNESQLRLQSWIATGCNAFNSTRPMSTPMSFFTEQDVLQWYLETNTEYCKDIYGEIIETKQVLQMDMFGGEDERQEYALTGEDRTGCMWCMFGLSQQTKENNGCNKFTKMHKTHPKQWDAVINKYGGKEVLEYMKLPYK